MGSQEFPMEKRRLTVEEVLSLDASIVRGAQWMSESCCIRKEI
jgi:hypothetical protein